MSFFLFFFPYTKLKSLQGPEQDNVHLRVKGTNKGFIPLSHQLKQAIPASHPCTETLMRKLLPASEQIWMETRQMRQSALGNWYQETGAVSTAPVTLETLRSIVLHFLPRFPPSSCWLSCTFTEGSGWAHLPGDCVRWGLISEWESAMQWFVLSCWACTLTLTLVSSRCQKQR